MAQQSERKAGKSIGKLGGGWWSPLRRSSIIMVVRLSSVERKHRRKVVMIVNQGAKPAEACKSTRTCALTCLARSMWLSQILARLTHRSHGLVKTLCSHSGSKEFFPKHLNPTGSEWFKAAQSLLSHNPFAWAIGQSRYSWIEAVTCFERWLQHPYAGCILRA